MAQYTDQQRAEALELYTEHGPAEASRRTGIARGTISQWAHRAGVTVTRENRAKAATEAAMLAWEVRRATLSDRLGREADALLDRVAGADDRNARHLMTAAAIAIDKAELLSGRATGRFEHSNTDPMDAEIAQLLDEEAARRAAATNGAGH